jgi:hypothetical protein
MRHYTRAAAAFTTVAIALLALGNEPRALAAAASKAPLMTGEPGLVIVKLSCPRLVTPKCANGYRAECTRWVYAGPKGPNMVKCCGRMGCVPVLKQRTRRPTRQPKPLPGS